MRGLVCSMIFTIVFPLVSYPQVNVIPPRSSESIEEIEKKATENLLSKGKHSIIKEINDFLESPASVEDKNRAMVRLAEMMIYSTGGLLNAHEMLVQLLEHVTVQENKVWSEANYLLGVINYIKSQTSNHSFDRERQRLKENGTTSEEDPFLTRAKEYFERVASKEGNEGSQKAYVAYRALQEPGSFEAFQFYNTMALMSDEFGRSDLLVAVKQYQGAIAAYENGDVGFLFSDPNHSEEEKVRVMTDLSFAYFKLNRYNAALMVNQMGLAQFGVDELTSNLRFNRAFIYKYSERLDLAENEYKSIINEFPVAQDVKETAEVRLAQVLSAQQKTEEAQTLLNKLLTTSKDDILKKQVSGLLESLIVVPPNPEN